MIIIGRTENKVRERQGPCVRILKPVLHEQKLKVIFLYPISNSFA